MDQAALGPSDPKSEKIVAAGCVVRGFPRAARSGGSSSEKRARSRALDSGGQATKGAWGMTRHQEALKGAEDCDKPGVTVKQVMIPGLSHSSAPFKAS